MSTRVVAVTTAGKAISKGQAVPRSSLWRVLVRDVKRNRYIYLMLAPVVAYYLVFYYGPMYGAQIAFRDFNPAQGIWSSPWVGLANFQGFFNGFYFWRLVRNTLLINVLDVLLGFPAPIILALLLNEIRSNAFKRTVQTITYMPHFISLVVVVGFILDFLARDGLVNNLLGAFGVQPVPFMQRPEWFRFIYVGSGIWQNVGWGSIIYLAAMSNIDPTLYEAAMVDGAGRFRQLWHITLPGITSIIVILLILRLGAMMTVGYEKVILMYNPMTYETADVISTYVFRKGILETNYSYSAAVGLFNSIINFGLLVIANSISRRINQASLW
ncbi:MAG: sugar ABC transporter permease [Chloroflexi bacterium]|nr:sugar ABC transporter permease [Chloroflexota bacterium]